jgi:hypothetical protein
MYFDRPGLILLVLLATFGPLAGLAVVRAMNDWKAPIGWDAIFSFLTLAAIDLLNGLVISAWIAQMYDEYKDLKSGASKPVMRAEPQAEKRILLDMNTGKPLYAFQTPAVKIDVMSRKIKHFCIVLVNQRDHGFKIDLKEETWKKHFGGRDHYVHVRDVRLAGAFAKESSRTNSPFVVVDWGVVEDGARGRM